MSISKKEIQERERKEVFSKPIVTKNKSFDLKQIQDFFHMFHLYTDNRNQADVRQIVTTARTLGFDKSHEFIFNGLVGIAEQLDGEWVNFEVFLTLLTERIGNPVEEEGRRQAFTLVDIEGKERLNFNDLKKLSNMLKFNLTDDQIQEVITNVSGKGKRDITWEQFNSHIAKKMEKRNQ